MATFEPMLLGHTCDVEYDYFPAERTHPHFPSQKDYVEITSIAIESKDGCGRVFIDPNELHKSQLDDLEREAMDHYKERGA